MAKEIPLTKGRVAIVDDEDYEWLSRWKWYYTKCANTGYAKRNRGKCSGAYMHREIMNPSTGMFVDHINGNPLDNRRDNLRVCTPHQNKIHTKGRLYRTSQYKGVYLDKRHGTWWARIKKDGKNHSLGRFPTERDAALAYNEAAMHLHGEFAWLNTIDETEA